MTYVARAVALPGSKAVVFETGNFERGGVAALALADRRLVRISNDGSDPFYSPTGHVLFPRENTLFAIPFDAETLEVRGEAVPVLQGVRVENAGAIQADLAANGTLVYVPASGRPGTSLALVRRDGRVDRIVGDRRNYATPRVSPDGARAVVVVNDGGRTDLWLVDLGTGMQTQVTSMGNATSPAWSQDGTWVAFGAPSGDRFGLFRVDLASRRVRELYTSEYALLPMATTRDDTGVLYIELSPRNDVFVLQLSGEGSAPEVLPIVQTEWAEEGATLSRDGSLLAYESWNTGAREVYVRELATGRQVQVSPHGGQEPVWSRDADEIFFRDTRGLMVAGARVTVEPDLGVGEPEMFFSATPYWLGLVESGYDTTPDGGFLMVRQRDPDAPPDQIHVIVNFADRPQ